MNEAIKIKDREDVLEISYEDMIKYHGRLHIAGVAIAYKALQLGFEKLLPGKVPERKKVGFVSGLGEGATGVLDAVEMVARVRTRGMLGADKNMGKDVQAPATPDGGKFYFELTYDGARLGLALKEGLIPEEFMTLLRKAMDGKLQHQDALRLQEVKEEMASSLMAHEAEELFNCIYY